MPCPTCGRLFRFPYYLSRHRLSHSGLRPHACPLCPKAFRRPAHLSRHLRGHGPQPPLRCAACPRTFPEPAQLRRHLAQEHAGGGVELAIDRAAKEAAESGWGPQDKAAEQPPGAGAEEEEAAAEEAAAARPEPWAAGEPATPAAATSAGPREPEGAEAEAGAAELRAELALAAGRQEEKQVLLQADWTLLCLRCREAFATKGELKAHPCLRPEGDQEGEGGPPPRPKRHQCSICLKAFARPWSLSRHRLVHSTDRPFVCTDCGLAFRLASYLRQHRRVHGALSLLAPLPAAAKKDDKAAAAGGRTSGRGPEGGEGAERGAAAEGGPGGQNGGEAAPARAPAGEPRFWCPECGKGFRRRAHLRQHGVTHSGARPFQCVRCQREFKRLADLARHAQVHAGGPAPHPCPHCSRRFSRAYSLLRHQRCHRAELERAAAAQQALQAPASPPRALPPPAGQEAEGLPLPLAHIKEEPPSPGSPPQSPAAAAPPVFLSASCFDSQDHSAFEMEEEETESKAHLRGLGGLAS